MITGTVTTKITGANGLQRKAANTAKLAGIVSKWAHTMAAIATVLAPVDTGALRGSIKVVLEGWAAKVSAGEGLPDGRAVFQEMGFHHWISGAFIQNPYMRPAMEQCIAGFFAEVRAAVM